MKLPDFSDHTYWLKLSKWAKEYSDGCTGVKDFYVEACWEHDWHYKYGQTLDGRPISFREANARFRQVIQMESKLGRYQPLSWIRWIGVSTFGRLIWNHRRRRNEQPPTDP